MMRSHYLTMFGVLLVFIGLLSDISNAQCSQVRLRKALSQLSNSEWNSLNRGMLALKANGQLDRLTKLHRSGMQYHGTPYFFLMHRALLADFEIELLKVAPGLTGLPYWDELREGAGVTKSDVFTPNRFSPIAPGPLRGVFYGLRDDNNQLVTRNPQNIPTSFNWLAPNEVMTRALLRMGNYGDFSRIIEVSPHNQFHVVIGGHMGNPSISPSDPAFWVHHAYIDMLWALWQSLRPQNRENLQAWGTSRPSINPAEAVVLYNRRWSNRDMLFYRSRLCYQYTMPTSRASSLRRRSYSEEKPRGNVSSSNITTTRTLTPEPSTTVTQETSPNATETTSSQNTTPYFKQMWEAPEDAIYQVMPSMSLADWRGVEDELNRAINLLNIEIATGQTKPEDLPNIESLFFNSGMNCSQSQSAGDDYRDSLIPEVQQLAENNQGQDANKNGSLSSGTTRRYDWSYQMSFSLGLLMLPILFII